MPSMSAVRLAGFAWVASLGLLLGLLVRGGAPTAAVLLAGAGGALIFATCAMAERRPPSISRQTGSTNEEA